MTTAPGLAPRYHKVLEPKTLQALRQRFRGMNRWMLLIWRTGLGRGAEIWPAGFGRLMVIEHVGRKSGTLYRTPVNFTRCGPDLYCLAGFGAKTDWYQNALATPQIAVWLPDGRWTATAAEASDSPDRIGLMRKVLVDSGFASRAIGLDPRVADDDVLASATETYRLLRITPEEREDTAGGPGDLAWIWRPMLSAFVLGWWLGRRDRKT
ncbi:MAG: nitroreductase family deazaflavin-dependent oxidoreductase [Acidimicrobiia bacterium]|nr:nitroreductase family deazaflavin-dependent oxidoreductase [Acidimicrobiia bacterium]